MASTIDVVDQINQYVLKLIPGDEKEYLNYDKVDVDHNCEVSTTILSSEFLNTLGTYGLPNHKILLKVGVPIMLLRNINRAERLCNGTRLIITRLADHVIEGKCISGSNVGSKVYIARMSLSPSQSLWPFRLI